MAHCWDMRERGREAWAKWRGLISEQSRSGQSVAAFCRERGLCASQFFAWKKRLRQADADSSWKCRSWERKSAAQCRRRAAGPLRFGSATGAASWWSRASTPDHLRAVVAALETRA